MKDQIHALLANRVRALSASGALPLGEPPLFVVEPPRNPAHGDFSANLPLVLARAAKRPPLAVAARLMEGLRLPDFVASVEILPPGFINFRLKPAAILDVLLDILRGDARYGQSDACAGQSLQIEFVSANPTGPLHVGHGRGAAYGSALARLLRAVGCAVQTEYYVNDAGRQMDILALSVWLRYLETFGAGPALPDNAYRGAYIRDIAGALRDLRGARFVPADSVCLPENAEPEARLDGAIARCREVLGETDYSEIHRHACAAILAGIRADLAAFGVHFDRWYSERDLIGSGQLASALADLRQRGFITDRDGAQWFTSSRFGDEKDRVVVRENGAATYFATDIAYHTEKMARGYSGLINIWGADHHGYIPRIKAALSALGLDPERLQVLLVQFATLYRQGERVQMSTRSGEFVTLRELLEEVGPDAGRFFLSDAPVQSSISTSTSTSPSHRVRTIRSITCNTPMPGSAVCCARSNSSS